MNRQSERPLLQMRYTLAFLAAMIGLAFLLSGCAVPIDVTLGAEVVRDSARRHVAAVAELLGDAELRDDPDARAALNAHGDSHVRLTEEHPRAALREAARSRRLAKSKIIQWFDDTLDVIVAIL